MLTLNYSKILFPQIIMTLVSLLFLVSCGQSPQQEKAQRLVKLYLDSLDITTKYKVIEYRDFHPIYGVEDDSTQVSRKKSGKSNSDHKLRGWVIYVQYVGKDEFGNNGDHLYQFAFNQDLSKLIVGIEVK